MNKIEEIIKKIFALLRLTREQEDNDAIHEAISAGIVFKGTNLWILIFAIVVACVGLNMNSTAVIIGAMLISPLMGPINGVGYSVAIYDFNLLRRSLKNLAFAVGTALTASTLYFVLTPIHTEHAELLARTSPTIYDVLIAMFGGLAGVVAISSKNKGNVIPGVAIATALMPPLCTAGYGLAILNMSYFLGALYLFLINSVFIALSAMVVSQLLKFPKRGYLLSKEIKNRNIAISIVISLTVVPSVFFGYSLVKKEEYKAKADQFIQKVSLWEGNFLLDSEVKPAIRWVKLIYGGNQMDSLSRRRLMEKAIDNGLDSNRIKIEQGLTLNDFSELNSRDQKEAKLLGQIEHLKSELTSSDNRVDSLINVPNIGFDILREIKPLYPDIESCSYGIVRKFDAQSKKGRKKSIVLFTTKKPIDEEDQSKIVFWLKERLKTHDIIVEF